MAEGFDIEVMDADGALREAEERLEGHTRGTFMRKAAVGGGALLSSGAILGMLPELASAARPSKKQDIAILEYALTLEYLEAAFYKEAVNSGALTGQVLTYARFVGGHELTHVDALRQTIRGAGRKPPSSPSFNFQGTTKDQRKFITTSFVLENTGVRAYLGQVGNFRNKKYVFTAGTIVTIEARHAAAAAILVNNNPFQNTSGNSASPHAAFDRGASKATILSEVKKTHFIA